MTGVAFTKEPIYIGGKHRRVIVIRKFYKTDSGMIKLKSDNGSMAYVPTDNLLGIVEDHCIESMPDIDISCEVPEPYNTN